jgi:RimJ/RimL family protein N-acetyltransferase
MNLRPMTMDDADFMLELKNDNVTRNFALLTSEEIKKEDHYKFLENNIQYFQVIEDGGYNMIRVGAFRIQDNEISIWIAPKFRNCGYATSTLNKVKKDGMTAKIMVGNIPSINAFINAGFRPHDLIQVPLTHYILTYTAERWG